MNYEKAVPGTQDRPRLYFKEVEVPSIIDEAEIASRLENGHCVRLTLQDHNVKPELVTTPAGVKAVISALQSVRFISHALFFL